MKTRRIIPIILAALIFGGSLRAFASNERFLENCYVNENDNTLVLISSPTLGVNGKLDAKWLNITLGGTEIAVKSTADNASSGVPTTYCCLVDVSGSMNADQIEQAKSALNGIVDKMKDKDNMAIATLGNTLNMSDFTSDKNALKEKINSLSAGKEDTNLYAGIVNSLSALRTSGSAHFKKSLVLLTDGMDDMVSGYTRDEAIRAINDSSIPIYTVATVRDKSQAESAKALGEMARLSPGGAHYVPVIDGISGGDAGNAIAAAVNSGYVITADLSKHESGIKDEVVLRVRANREDGSQIEDSMTIYDEDLPRITPEPTVEPTIEPTETPVEATASPEPKATGKLKIIIPLSVIGAALIAGLLIFILRKKRDDTPDNDDNNDDAENEQDEELSETYTDGVDDIGETTAADDLPEPPENVNGIMINFVPISVKVGAADKSVSFFLPENVEKTIGRNSKADFVLNSGDKKLSGRNSILLYRNGQLFLSDAGSTNGTSHNGVPIHVTRVTVEKDDKIRVGSCEYRVLW